MILKTCEIKHIFRKFYLYLYLYL